MKRSPFFKITPEPPPGSRAPSEPTSLPRTQVRSRSCLIPARVTRSWALAVEPFAPFVMAVPDLIRGLSGPPRVLFLYQIGPDLRLAQEGPAIRELTAVGSVARETRRVRKQLREGNFRDFRREAGDVGAEAI